MSLSQLQQAMANIRMGLAEIQNKESQLDSMIKQFRTQLHRLPRQIVYGQLPLDASLSSMGEIEERLNDTIVTKERLLKIKKAATDELRALESVKLVDEAKSNLISLKENVATSNADIKTHEEIQRLEQFIAEHSKLAEIAITERYQERQSDII
ncbi:MAG: hypothetical protein CL886_02500 [Dehalococcoidia bacterium]|nr:hypothetical protein [Dehalococcoidia bacterium]|tara:strand:- start:10661 stop:11122 length:462 start_codon:yes stop_codon:yes gene_type:complete